MSHLTAFLTFRCVGRLGRSSRDQHEDRQGKDGGQDEQLADQDGERDPGLRPRRARRISGTDVVASRHFAVDLRAVDDSDDARDNAQEREEEREG